MSPRPPAARRDSSSPGNAKKSQRKRPPHPGEAERIADRRVHAFELRMAGHSYRDIGRMLNCNASTVCRDIHDEMASRAALTTAAAEDYRALDLERLDVAIQGLMPMARAGEPKSVMALMRTLERRAKLLGLDAPTKLAGPTGGPLELVQLYMPDNGRRRREEPPQA